MTAIPIRMHHTIVDVFGGEVAGPLPPGWEPGTPVLAVAGLPEGAELRRFCDVPEGWEYQSHNGEWVTRGPFVTTYAGLVVCRPKKPRTKRVPPHEAIGKVLAESGFTEPYRPTHIRHEEVHDGPVFADGVIVMPLAGLVDDDGMVEVLVDPAPTGDAGEKVCTECGYWPVLQQCSSCGVMHRSVVAGETTLSTGTNNTTALPAPTGDDEPQADTPAPHDFGDLSDPDHYEGKPMYPPWTRLFAALDAYQESPSDHVPSVDAAMDELADAAEEYRQSIEGGDLVRRDGTAPGPDLTPLFLALKTYESAHPGVVLHGAWRKVNAAVRALRDGGTR